MIAIAGSARRSYTFPAPLDVAFRFNADLDAMLGLLPHIEVVAATVPATRRLCYLATESGVYRVRIYCTVIPEIDARTHRIHIRPTDDPAHAHAGFRSMSGGGRYESTIRFQAHGEATRIDYELRLGAELPVPVALRLIPAAVIDVRAGRVFRARLDEILDGFVQRSIAAYRRFAARQPSDSATTRASRDRRA